MDSDKRTSPEHWRIQDILSYSDCDVKNTVRKILHSILVSSDILTWNSRGEIVYRRRNMPGTDIIDLIQYCVPPYNSDVPEPPGLNIFLRGLADVKIDKCLIENVRVLTMLARKEYEQGEDQSHSEETQSEIQTQSDEETQSDEVPQSDEETQSQDMESEDLDRRCKNCHKSTFNMVNLGTCSKCLWRDFYMNCTECHCKVCDSRLSRRYFTHVIAFCPNCLCDEIMDVCTNERHFFEPK